METEISKSQFKSHALEIFRKIEQTGTPAIITDHGKATLIVNKYTPYRADIRERLKGSVLRYDNPLAPVAVDDWAAMA